MMKNNKWTSEFSDRLEKNYDTMRELYGELYPGDEKAWEYFVTLLWHAYEERKPSLKRWDRDKGKDPDRFRSPDRLAMEMYVSSFAENLKGLIHHLDYLEETGIRLLHLMPLMESPKERSDGGYAVSNYRKVAPELGTTEDLSRLCDECRKRGISLVLDLVMNHTSEDHEWARKAKEGKKEYQSRYLFFEDWTIPNEYEKTLPQVFPQAAPGNFTWCEQVGKVVMTTFYPYQWDLNYANPMVLNDMAENMFYLCNLGADLIRLDTVSLLWKQLGTQCRNLPQAGYLVRILRLAVDIVCPGTVLLADLDMDPGQESDFFGDGEKERSGLICNDSFMPVVWHTLATRDVRLLRHHLESVSARSDSAIFLNYLRSHDDIQWRLDYRFLEQCGMEEHAHRKFLNEYLSGRIFGVDSRGEVCNDDPRMQNAGLCGTTASLCGLEAAGYEKNEEKIRRSQTLIIMLHALLLSQKGLPVIYSGDEIGQLNDYSYHEDPLKWEDNRFLHRGRFHWDLAGKRHDPDTVEGRIYMELKRLLEIRADHKVFHADADLWLMEPYNEHILALGRYYDGEKLIGLFNFSEEDQTAWINEEEDYKDLLTGQPRPAKAVGLPACSFAWLVYHF